MSSTPIYGSTGRRNSGRSRARTAQRSIDEHADSLTGQAAGGSVPMPSAPDARAFPEPTAHVPSFPEPQHQHSRSHNARDQVPAPAFPMPYGVPSFPEPEHHGFRPSFVDVENDADDEDSEISTIPPLPNPFDRSLPSLPDDVPGRSKPQRRATASMPVPSTSSSHPRTPARSATMLAPTQLSTSTPAQQQPPALGAGVSESRDAIASIPSMPSPTLPPHLPQAPPAMPSHSDYVSPPIPEESSYPSPASSHSYGRSHPTYRSDTASPHMPAPYGDARPTGYPNLISSNAPPPPEKPALSTDLAKIARPQDIRPGHRVPSVPRPLASPSESERAPSAISSPLPARSSDAPTIPTMPTVGSTIGPFSSSSSSSDDDGMSWATSAEQDPPRRAKTPPAKPAPPKASAAVATAAAASNFSEPLKASTTPSAPPASPHLKPSQPVNGDAASSKYSVTSAASRPRPDKVSSKPQPAPTSLQGSGQAHPKPTAPTPSKPTSKPQPTSEPTFKPKPPPTTAAAAPAEDTPTPIRPPLNPTGGSKHIGTEYTHMLLALDAVPFVHNVAANAATWLLLAGFVVLPGTFSTLSTLTPQSGTIEATVVHAVKNIPLFVVAYVLSGVGAGGMCWLWWRWSRNYIWLLGHIFVPGALNGLAGVFSTLATVLGTQSGVFSPSAITTLAVTGATATICGVLAGWYTFFMLGRVKREHEREVGKEGTGKHGEGYIKAAKELMGVKSR